MQITDVRIRKVEKEGKMKAVVSITIDEEFVVHDIKIIEGEKGLFIAMPSRKAADGEYRDIAHPINSQTRDHIQSLILEKYQELLNEAKFEVDDQKKAELYLQAEELVVKSGLIEPTYVEEAPTFVKKYVKNYFVSTVGQVDFSKVYIEK